MQTQKRLIPRTELDHTNWFTLTLRLGAAEGMADPDYVFANEDSRDVYHGLDEDYMIAMIDGEVLQDVHADEAIEFLEGIAQPVAHMPEACAFQTDLGKNHIYASDRCTHDQDAKFDRTVAEILELSAGVSRRPKARRTAMVIGNTELDDLAAVVPAHTLARLTSRIKKHGLLPPRGSRKAAIVEHCCIGRSRPDGYSVSWKERARVSRQYAA